MTAVMIGADPHKSTHTAVAIDRPGREHYDANCYGGEDYQIARVVGRDRLG